MAKGWQEQRHVLVLGQVMGQGGKASRGQTRALNTELTIWLRENIRGPWWAAGGLCSVPGGQKTEDTTERNVSWGTHQLEGLSEEMLSYPDGLKYKPHQLGIPGR